MECCGNCFHRETQQQGNYSEEWCKYRDNCESSEHWCNSWAYDGLKNDHRGIFDNE